MEDMGGLSLDARIESFVSFCSNLQETDQLIGKLKTTNERFYRQYNSAQRVIGHFQNTLTDISGFICNRENAVDDIEELLKKAEIPKDLRSKIQESPVDEDYETVIKQLNRAVEVAAEFRRQGFIIGFEVQKELDPIIDRAVKRILTSLTDLLINTRDIGKMANWHDVQQQNLVPKAELMKFVEVNRPTAASPFISKYCDLSAGYYASCAKGFFLQLEKRPKILAPILMGDSVEISNSKSSKTQRRSTFSLISTFSGSRSSQHNGPESPISAVSASLQELSVFVQIPHDASRLLLQLLDREIRFFRELFGEIAHVRRKSVIPRMFTKCFSIVKGNLKEIVHENGHCQVALQMMSALTDVEFEVSASSDLSAPSQWLNELQNLVYDDFKRLLRKQIESLASYSDLKTSLSSGECHHHFVVRRFANFMQTCLELLKSFKKPWDVIYVDLKKLEHAFYSWMQKISMFVKDRREGLLFQINNFDLVIEVCKNVAGAEFMASLQFKYEPLIARLIQLEHEKYFADLLNILKDPAQAQSTELISLLNSRIPQTMQAVANAIRASSLTDFSSIPVAEEMRAKFLESTLKLYKDYLDYYDSHYGKNELVEGEVQPCECEMVRKLLYENMKIS